MKSIAKLKEQARALEQKAAWAPAIQVYLQVLALAEQGDQDLDLSLYNRIGDLYLRLDRREEAVNYYEQAAERYSDAGLFNNAIALCNKALRYLPTRTSLLRKLGRLSLQQGFLSDARRWYLDYAERMQQRGQLSDAFDALTEFAEQADAPDIRELLGNLLIANGRFEDGVSELTRAYGEMLRRPASHEAAEALRSEILKLAPRTVLPDRPPSPVATPRTETTTAEAARSVAPPDASAAPAQPLADSLEVESAAAAAGLQEDASEVVEPLSLLDPELGGLTAEEEPAIEMPEGLQTLAGAAGLDAAATSPSDVTDELALLDLSISEPDAEASSADDEPLSTLALDLGDLGDLGVEPPQTQPEPLTTGEELLALPQLAADPQAPFEPPVANVEEGGALPLPLLDDLDTLSLPEAAEPLPLLDLSLDIDDESFESGMSPVHAEPPRPGGRGADEAPEAAFARARELAQSGQENEAAAELRTAHEAFAARERWDEALAAATELTRHQPEDLAALRARVEYAAQAADPEQLADAYLAFAHHLARTGAAEKAAALYRQALELDPANEVARAALSQVERGEV